jgi:hypothetical protein
LRVYGVGSAVADLHEIALEKTQKLPIRRTHIPEAAN